MVLNVHRKRSVYLSFCSLKRDRQTDRQTDREIYVETFHAVMTIIITRSTLVA